MCPTPSKGVRRRGQPARGRRPQDLGQCRRRRAGRPDARPSCHAATCVATRTASSSWSRRIPYSSATTSSGSPARNRASASSSLAPPRAKIGSTASGRSSATRPGAPAREDRLPQAAGRLDDQLRDLVRREPDQGGVVVGRELQPRQIRAHHLVGHVLVVAHDHEFACRFRRALVLAGDGVVVEHLGAVGKSRRLARAWARPSSASSRSIAGLMRCIGTPLRRIALRT